MGAIDPISTSGDTVLDIQVAPPTPAIVGVSMGRIPGLPPKASWMLTMVSNAEPGNCKPALPECIMLPLAEGAAGEVKPTDCAGATITFSNSKEFLGCCPITGPRCRLRGSFYVQGRVGNLGPFAD